MNAKKEIAREFLTHQKGAKVVAFVLAVIVWYAIQPTISFEQTISDVPVRILIDPGWAVLAQSVDSVDVDLRGSRDALRNLVADDLELVVDARGLPPGALLTLPLTIRNLRTPAGVRPVFVRPAEITLNIDEEIDRELPVRVHLQGTPPEGYRVESHAAEPDRVIVRGPRQRLEAVEYLRTMPIDLEGRAQSFRRRMDLAAPSRAWTARMDPDRVEVDVQIDEQTARLVLEDVPIRLLAADRVDHRFAIEPQQVQVEVVGRPILLEALTRDDVRAYVELPVLDAAEWKQQVNVRVHLPPDVRLGAIWPDSVEVTTQGMPEENAN